MADIQARAHKRESEEVHKSAVCEARVHEKGPEEFRKSAHFEARAHKRGSEEDRNSAVFEARDLAHRLPDSVVLSLRVKAPPLRLF